MKLHYLNPNYSLSRFLEKMGVKTYLERTEFAAHFFAGCTFALIGYIWTVYMPLGWVIWTVIDEFVVDGYKGRDTGIDLLSKLIVPLGMLIWLGLTFLV